MSGDRARVGCCVSKMANHQDICLFERVLIYMLLSVAHRCDLCGCVRCRRRVEACSPTEEENGQHQHPVYIEACDYYIMCFWQELVVALLLQPYSMCHAPHLLAG